MAILLNQTQRLMKHPTTWRFVGLASATIGLLCLALSSSFNSLFKQWNLLKTFLHCVFSFIIFMTVLFAKLWHQSTTSLRLKAHMAFLVLIITPFCTFLTMKPDTCSVVSCAGFALMWLILSSQTRCRFEMGLFYFFLGILIVQLIKMNWLLGIVGASFSYSLIILCSCLDSLPQTNGYVGVGLQDHSQLEIQVDSLKSQSQSNPQYSEIIQDKTEINVFKPRLLNAIKALREKNLFLIRLLNWNLGKCFQPDHNLFIERLPLEIINNLNEAMKVSVDAGFEECFQLYTSCRKEFLQQCFSELNLKIFIDSEYESSGTTTERIQKWIRDSEIAVQVLFRNERSLCDRVFYGISSIGNLSFVQICKEPAICLLKFPKTFVVETNWPMIFKEVLEVLKTLVEIIPDLESMFPDQEAMSLKNEAIKTQKRLGEAIRDIFKDMENLIHSDTRIADVPGGIYPIAHDVLNCLHRVTKVRTTFEKVWEEQEHPIVPKKEGTTPSFFLQMTEIMELLDTNLEARSKNYTEPALCYVSMINNAMFTQQKTEKLRNLAKTDYYSRESYQLYNNFNYLHFIKHTIKVQQYIEGYLRSSWNEVLGLLKLDKEEEESASPGLAAESMKEKLQLFNIQFDQICSIQSKWFAFDSVRREITNTLENMLLPAYGYFIGRFHDFLGKRADEYIQFGIFDIKARLEDMFLGGKGEINRQQ